MPGDGDCQKSFEQKIVIAYLKVKTGVSLPQDELVGSPVQTLESRALNYDVGERSKHLV